MHYTNLHGSCLSILGWALVLVAVLGGFWYALQLQGTIAAVSAAVR